MAIPREQPALPEDALPRYPQAILVSCEIPWDEKEQLLEDVFRREVRWVLAAGFNHLYVFGTAGEGYAVDTARFQDIVRLFWEETQGPDVHPMVGVIALSTAQFVERLGFAHDAGFRTFQICLPSWGALSDAEVDTFFKDVCGAFPDSRFLHYNLGRARRLLAGRDYRRIADRVPNLAATKNTLTSAADLLRHAPDLQHFLGERNFAEGCLYGECSLLASLGLTIPHRIKAYFAAGVRGDVDRLFRLHHDLLRFQQDIIEPLVAESRIDGAYDKALVKMGGFDAMPLRLLSPYQGLSDAHYEYVHSLFRDLYPDWS